MQRLTKHFTLKEFTDSDTAARRGIDNAVPAELMPEAVSTAEMMERIRAHLGAIAGDEVPITITSGYRCLHLNRTIGSRDSSDHRKAAAVDFRAPTFGTPLAICLELAKVMDELDIGQLIYEHTWVHVSRITPARSINRIITAQAGAGYVPGIVGA